jgi:hypothetical protein
MDGITYYDLSMGKCSNARKTSLLPIFPSITGKGTSHSHTLASKCHFPLGVEREGGSRENCEWRDRERKQGNICISYNLDICTRSGVGDYRTDLCVLEIGIRSFNEAEFL